MLCEYAIVICPKTSKPCDYRNCMGDCKRSQFSGVRIATVADCLRIYGERKDVSYRRIRNVTVSVLNSMRLLGLDLSTHVDAITYRRLKELISIMEDPKRCGKNYSHATIADAVGSFGALGAEELRDAYDDEGFPRPMFDVPRYHVTRREVKGMTDYQELLVDKWMYKLSASSKKREQRMFIALWFERLFAVRPGDINNLKWDCIVAENGKHYLRYLPRKTMKVSNRKSNIVIHSKIYKWIEPFIRPGEYVMDKDRRGAKKKKGHYARAFGATWNAINRQFRSWGICDDSQTGKASYINRRQRISEAFRKDGFFGSCAIGMNTPKVQFNNYLISGEYAA